jgi:thioredoxin-like negative regulator of GroEL
MHLLSSGLNFCKAIYREGYDLADLSETNYEQFKSQGELENPVVVLAYTPTCGTCMVAKKMVKVTKELLSEISFVQINLNLNEKFSIEFEVMSVPCLLIFKDGICVEKVYTFRSVPFLYEKLKGFV